MKNVIVTIDTETGKMELTGNEKLAKKLKKVIGADVVKDNTTKKSVVPVVFAVVAAQAALTNGVSAITQVGENEENVTMDYVIQGEKKALKTFISNVQIALEALLGDEEEIEEEEEFEEDEDEDEDLD